MAKERLEERLGISFADGKLLSQALTHPSAVNEDPQEFAASNQRLEFLGDSFIDFVAARELYLGLPQMTEGQLTELRSSVVRGEALARVARSITLGSYLYMGQGEEGSGGRGRDSNLAAALEAVVGAILLGNGLEDAYAVTARLLQSELDRVIQEGAPRDPKSRLQEVMQGMGKGAPVYTTVSEDRRRPRKDLCYRGRNGRTCPGPRLRAPQGGWGTRRRAGGVEGAGRLTWLNMGPPASDRPHWLIRPSC